jgi:hypothetical protein
MISSDTVRFDQKQTIAAYDRQVQNLQQLLALQTNETKHCQDHILMLNREVDSLRKIIEEKQKSIHDLQRQLRKKQDFSAEIEKKYDESKIDKLAFFELEERNMQLLEGLKRKTMEVDKLQVENRYLQEHREDRLLLEEIKAKKAVELEITFPYERTQLQVRLDHAQEVNNSQALRIQVLETHVQQLTQNLEDHQEKMKDLLLRSKQSEFKMLMELDAKDSENHALDIQNHQMQLTQQSLTSHASELTAQLNNSVNQTESLQTLFSSAIDTLENDVKQLQYKEKILKRENQLLQLEGQVQKDVISRVSTALLEPGKLPAKKDKGKSTKTNPLSLSATLPTMVVENDSRSSSRPNSASVRPKSQSAASRSTASSTTLRDQKYLSKRSPLHKFGQSGGSRASTASANILLDEMSLLPSGSQQNSRSSLHTAVPQFQPPHSAVSTASTSTVQGGSNQVDPVLNAFSPFATGNFDTTVSTNEDGNVGTTPFDRTAGSALFYGAAASPQRLPQHEIAAVDLKNTMLHRFMQMTCRCFEAVGQMEKILAQSKAPNSRFSNIISDLNKEGISEENDGNIFSEEKEATSRGRKASLWTKTNPELGPFLSMGIVEEINLGNCSLVDVDLNAVIDWLRTIPVHLLLPCVHSISLQHNLLTADALLKLFAWISSFSIEDWQCITDRGFPIEIDFKYNQIMYEAIGDAIKYMRKAGNPDIAFIALMEEERERKLMFHVKSRTHQQGSCIALIFDLNKQKGDHKNRLLRNSLSSSWQSGQVEQQKRLGSLSFREPLVSKIQTFTTESVYPILQTAGLLSESTAAMLHSSVSPSKARTKRSQNAEGQVDDDSNIIPRDLIMTHDFIG